MADALTAEERARLVEELEHQLHPFLEDSRRPIVPGECPRGCDVATPPAHIATMTIDGVTFRRYLCSACGESFDVEDPSTSSR